jgi:pimeloyl-ACP methyl ester carboxylesterase
VRLAAATLTLAVLLPVPTAVAAPQSPVQVRVIHYRAHDGRTRSAYLLLPRHYDGRPIPLVISPHGRGLSARQNARFFGVLPGLGRFAVIDPEGEGRRLGTYSWGAPGQIADLARMPQIAEDNGVNVDRSRIYAVGGSMGGQEVLLLVARHPHLLAGAAAFDPATDMARRYWDFAALKGGRRLQQLARTEIGGTPLTAPLAYARRSPDNFVRQLALSGVPLELYWSTRDGVIRDQVDETGLLVVEIHGWNPRARVLSFRGTWGHTREMWPRGRLPDALARFDLLPWSLVPRRYVPTRDADLTRAVSRSATRSVGDSIPTESRTRLRGAANGASAVDACVIRAGCSIRLSTPPRDSARVKSFVREQSATASSSDSARKQTMPPKSRIWRRAVSWPGWEGKPG